VSVRSGAATVKQAGQISRLQEGQSITRSVAERCPAPVAGSPATTPAVASSFAGGTSLYWVIGGGAVAGVTAGVLATRGGKSISPSAP
jgi:hypothetical protein